MCKPVGAGDLRGFHLSKQSQSTLLHLTPEESLGAPEEQTQEPAASLSLRLRSSPFVLKLLPSSPDVQEHARVLRRLGTANERKCRLMGSNPGFAHPVF